jgi:hypothetical protein
LGSWHSATELRPHVFLILVSVAPMSNPAAVHYFVHYFKDMSYALIRSSLRAFHVSRRFAP